MIARIGLILLRLFTALGVALPWLANFVVWFKRRALAISSEVAAHAAEAGVRSAALFVVETALVLLWGVVLAALTTGVSGLSIKEFMTQNPFSGFPSAMMFLVAGAFPVHFAVGLVTGYIAWKFTFGLVVLGVNKSVRFLYGS